MPASQVHGSTQVWGNPARTPARTRVNVGTSMDPWTCPMEACDRIHNHWHMDCTCLPCACETCTVRRIKATFNATEPDE